MRSAGSVPPAPSPPRRRARIPARSPRGCGSGWLASAGGRWASVAALTAIAGAALTYTLLALNAAPLVQGR